MPPRKTLAELRSRRWFAATDMRAFAHRQRMQQMGLRREDVLDHPIIAIVNTWSDLSPCHAHLRERAEAVKRGVLMAGGMPFELPAMSLGEVMVKPTTMLYRNFLAMEVEELLRSLPIDGVVLLAGCDKTTPATVMGAISAGLPTLFCAAGPMLSDRYLQPGQPPRTVGAGTHTRMFWDEYQAGHISEPEWVKLEAHMTRAPGTCNTMGTASTMACMAEALGTSLPHNAAIPAVDSRRYVLAQMSGMRAVEMAREGLTLSKILTRQAFENAIRVNAAIGGSTNAVIHLKAIAGRIGVPLSLEDWTTIGRDTPTLVDLMPSGRFLMEEFYYAGGLPAVLRRLGEHGLLPHPDALTVNGHSLWHNVKEAPSHNDEVIRPLSKPLMADGGIRVLRGNLSPNGAVLKPSAATPELLRHRGRAVVFENLEHYKERIVDESLDVDASSVLVLKRCGPRGYPGMAEVGNMGLPPKLLRQGITDMVRISDARMSGTAYGTVVLHVAPEAAAGGPLAVVRDGDWIELDCDAGRLHLDISDAELADRLANLRAEEAAAQPPGRSSGYERLYVDHVLQADEGCDFDFLVGCRGNAVPRHSH